MAAEQDPDKSNPETDARAESGDDAGAGPESTDSRASEDAAGPGEPAAPATDVEVDPLQAEVAALRDQLLRSQAEIENVRRRARREVENARKFALERFVGDLLPLADSLEKCIESSTGVLDEGPARAVVEGVELSVKLMLDILGKHGVERIDPTGEDFDPQFHEAMSMLEQPDARPNSVLFTHQKGYVLNDRLVRAAKVVVVRPPAGGAIDEQA